VSTKRQVFFHLVACSLAIASAARAQQAPATTYAPVQFAEGWKFPESIRATFAEHAMVASSSRLAASVGADILKAGGNAVDAAVAVGFALTVVYPEAGNIGGGGYMVIRMANGRTAALDYRETAPGSSFRDMYVDSAGQLTSFSERGRSAAGVPGAVAGLITAHERFGRLSFRRVIAPAIRLAADGFIVDSVLARSVRNHEDDITQYAGTSLFFPNGAPVAVGSRLVQAELAQTLRDIAVRGRNGFYRGRVAGLIVAEMQRDCPAAVTPRRRASHGCGLITFEDLERYRPVWRKPINSAFRGYTLISMPPSSSGGITVGESLNILDGFPKLPAFGTPEYTHLIAATFQRSFADRNSLLGDPDVVNVPVQWLLSRAHAEELRKSIDPARATPTQSLKMPAREGTETTHYSVVDAEGNAVATTTTLNGLYGAGVFVKGAGFFLNNTMDDFAAQPGKPNQFGLVQGEANAVAPGKRMLSAMSPTIVLDPAGKLFMVVGARGGPRIITSTAQVILNVIEHRMSLADAMRAPRIHYQGLPDSVRIDATGFEKATLAKLASMGYTLQPLNYIGGTAVAIRRVRGGWEGMDDPRGAGGGAVGY
jgi:gamma-glutamyltranspeptidase/glutathione hydrolase